MDTRKPTQLSDGATVGGTGGGGGYSGISASTLPFFRVEGEGITFLGSRAQPKNPRRFPGRPHFVAGEGLPCSRGDLQILALSAGPTPLGSALSPLRMA